MTENNIAKKVNDKEWMPGISKGGAVFLTALIIFPISYILGGKIAMYCEHPKTVYTNNRHIPAMIETTDNSKYHLEQTTDTTYSVTDLIR